MQKINTQIDLRDAIILLEGKQAIEQRKLKEKMHDTMESMRPVNLIRSTFREVAASQDIKTDLMTASVGLAAGYLSKVLFEGVSRGPLRKLFGTALMLGITNVVAKNPEAVKSVGHKLFKLLRSSTARKVNKTDTIGEGV